MRVVIQAGIGHISMICANRNSCLTVPRTLPVMQKICRVNGKDVMLMLTRTDLEIPRSTDEMYTLVSSFATDRVTYPDKDVHLRKGIVKDILEEYVPLLHLACYLGAKTGRLLTISNNGPDAIIQLQTGKEIKVQITVANESYQEALTREILSEGKSASAWTKKGRDPRTRKIKEGAHFFAVREPKLREEVMKIVNAVKKKINNFHQGTDVLLVATKISIGDTDINYSWKQDLRGQVAALDPIPYKRLYIINNDEVVHLIE
jgi:hypothetical protein